MVFVRHFACSPCLCIGASLLQGPTYGRVACMFGHARAPLLGAAALLLLLLNSVRLPQWSCGNDARPARDAAPHRHPLDPPHGSVLEELRAQEAAGYGFFAPGPPTRVSQALVARAHATRPSRQEEPRVHPEGVRDAPVPPPTAREPLRSAAAEQTSHRQHPPRVAPHPATSALDSPRPDVSSAPEATPPQPPPRAPAFQNATLLGAVAYLNTVFIVLCDGGFVQFASNVALHFRSVMPDHVRLLAFALDPTMWKWCRETEGVVCHGAPQTDLCRYNASDERMQRLHSIMTPKWKALLNCKMQLIYDILALGYHVFWMDGDSLLLRDPTAVLPLQYDWEGSCTERSYERHPTDPKFVRGTAWDTNTGTRK